MKRTSKKSQLKAESTLQNREEVSIMDSDWRSILEGLINDERSNNDIIGTDKIQALDKEMGFGYISDEKIEAKVVLQGSNPFMDNMRGDLNPDVVNYEPYSQIYNVTGIRKGSNFLILRSYTFQSTIIYLLSAISGIISIFQTSPLMRKNKFL